MALSSSSNSVDEISLQLEADQNINEDNLEKKVADIKEKINKMNNIIENKTTFFQKNKLLETNFLTSYDEVQTDIQKYSLELKDQIDDIKNKMISKIPSIQNQLLKSIKIDENEQDAYITSLRAKKSHYTEVINNESNENIVKLEWELNWIESEKEIKVTFEKPSLKKMISSELLKSIKVNCGEVGTVLCQRCKRQFDQVCTLECGHQFCKSCFSLKIDGKEIICLTCFKYALKYTMELMDEQNLSINIVYCPNCGRRYDEVHTLPCLHQFCKICKEFMEEGENIDCMLCFQNFKKNRVLINSDIEKVLENASEHPLDDEIIHVLSKEENNGHSKNEKFGQGLIRRQEKFL